MQHTAKCQLLNLHSTELSVLGITHLCCCPAAMHGPIPRSFERLQKLEVLSLEANAFSGTLPPYMCRNMTALNVSLGSWPAGPAPACSGWNSTCLHLLAVAATGHDLPGGSLHLCMVASGCKCYCTAVLSYKSDRQLLLSCQVCMWAARPQTDRIMFNFVCNHWVRLALAWQRYHP